VGYSEATIGLLWLTGGFAEVVVFGLAGNAARRAGPMLVIAFGIAGGALRWTITAFDPPLAVLFVTQALHACSFSLTHLGTMNYIQARVAPQLRNTAQGLYAALSGGLAMSVLTLFAGHFYRDYGGHAYLAMAAVSALGFVFALLLFRLSPRVPMGQGA
jgi:PPP family 3-phenylpropionic acid transporter